MLRIPDWFIFEIKQKLERVGFDNFSLRKYINENQRIFFVVPIVCVLILLITITSQCGDQRSLKSPVHLLVDRFLLLV